MCEAGTWRDRNGPGIPDCQAVCLPECQNGGVCIRPGVCHCQAPAWEGARCQRSKGADFHSVHFFTCWSEPTSLFFFRHNCHFGEYHPHLHHHDFRGSVSFKPTYAEKWESILQRFGQYHNTCFCNGHIIAGTGAVNQMYSFAHCGFLSTGDQNECSVRCLSGHAFTDGTTEAELSCHHGVWDPVEDCNPVCDPPCQNGGRCLSENQCLCGEVCALSMHTLTINTLVVFVQLSTSERTSAALNVSSQQRLAIQANSDTTGDTIAPELEGSVHHRNNHNES